MILYLLRLLSCSNKKRVLIKKRNREVQLYVKSREVWIQDITQDGVFIYCIKKNRAKYFNFIEAVRLTRNCSSNIEFHFKDNFGENVLSIKDTPEEEIYNNPSIKFQH